MARLEIDLVKVEALAAQGLTNEQIADALGISERTVRNRKIGDAEFAAAIKRGKAKGIGVVSNALFQQAKDGNVTAMIFFLKCRAGWSEKQIIDNISSDGSMTPAGKSLSDFYKDLKAKSGKSDV